MDSALFIALLLCGASIFGYFCGNFSLSYLLAKRRGFDIRTQGTGNAGASNAAVTMGWKIGVLVGFCDIMKCFIAVLAVKLIFSGLGLFNISDLYRLAPYIAGVSCVLGHMHPFYLRFRGGKGFASYLGMVLAINWKLFIIIGLGILAVALISNYIVMGTMLTMVSFPLAIFIFEKNLIAALIAAALSLLIIYRHRKNLLAIVRGEERKISGVFGKKKKKD